MSVIFEKGGFKIIRYSGETKPYYELRGWNIVSMEYLKELVAILKKELG